MISLAALNDDVWTALARHLDLPSLHALTLSSPCCYHRTRRLFPALTRHISSAHRREAVAKAVAVDDPALASFALYAGGDGPSLLPDTCHPLLASYAPCDPCLEGGMRDCIHGNHGGRAALSSIAGQDGGIYSVNDANNLIGQYGDRLSKNADASGLDCANYSPFRPSLSLAVARVLRASFIGAGGTPGSTLAPERLSLCENDDVVLYMAREAARHPTAMQALHALIVSLAYRCRAALVCELLRAHPSLSVARGRRLRCHSCLGQHGLLHAAAETGSVEIVSAVMEAHDGGAETLLPTIDCIGESALGIALTFRETRVAQELVRLGARTRDLVGCAARGGGRLRADQVWYKEELDVD